MAKIKRKTKGAKGLPGDPEVAVAAPGPAMRKPNPQEPSEMNKAHLQAGGIGLFKNADEEYHPALEPRQEMLQAAARLMHPPTPDQYQDIADMPLQWKPPTPSEPKAPGAVSGIPDPASAGGEMGEDNPILMAAGLEVTAGAHGAYGGYGGYGAKGAKKKGAKGKGGKNYPGCGMKGAKNYPGCKGGAGGLPAEGITELPLHKKASVGGGEKRAFGPLTWLGGGLGLARAPKGYAAQGAARGAVKGFGTEIGTGLGGAAGILAALALLRKPNGTGFGSYTPGVGAGLTALGLIGTGALGGGYLGNQLGGWLAGNPGLEKQREAERSKAASLLKNASALYKVADIAQDVDNAANNTSTPSTTGIRDRVNRFLEPSKPAQPVQYRSVGAGGARVKQEAGQEVFNRARREGRAVRPGEVEEAHQRALAEQQQRVVLNRRDRQAGNDRDLYKRQQEAWDAGPRTTPPPVAPGQPGFDRNWKFPETPQEPGPTGSLRRGVQTAKGYANVGVQAAKGTAQQAATTAYNTATAPVRWLRDKVVGPPKAPAPAATDSYTDVATATGGLTAGQALGNAAKGFLRPRIGAAMNVGTQGAGMAQQGAQKLLNYGKSLMQPSPAKPAAPASPVSGTGNLTAQEQLGRVTSGTSAPAAPTVGNLGQSTSGRYAPEIANLQQRIASGQGNPRQLQNMVNYYERITREGDKTHQAIQDKIRLGQQPSPAEMAFNDRMNVYQNSSNPNAWSGTNDKDMRDATGAANYAMRIGTPAEAPYKQRTAANAAPQIAQPAQPAQAAPPAQPRPQTPPALPAQQGPTAAQSVAQFNQMKQQGPAGAPPQVAKPSQPPKPVTPPKLV